MDHLPPAAVSLELLQQPRMILIFRALLEEAEEEAEEQAQAEKLLEKLFLVLLAVIVVVSLGAPSVLPGGRNRGGFETS